MGIFNVIKFLNLKKYISLYGIFDYDYVFSV